jgi:predicted LPLAT superfamily acyltransferase
MSPPAAPPKVWVVIPVHNNAGTVRNVALECRDIVPDVLVVDDGSRDADVSALMSGTGIRVLRHDVNRGKGGAILTAAREIERLGGTTMITIDGDGQHHPRDLHAFLAAIREDQDCIVIGERDMTGKNVPGSSRFGRAFSDFWVRLETGVDVRDTQSGFRAYPVRHILQLGCVGRRYDFEVEILTRAAWAGLPIRNVPIGVFYPPAAERVSSFRPFMDNLWLTHRHALLVMRRALPLPHRRLVAKRGDRLRRPRGNTLGFWFFLTAVRLTGLRGAYGLLFIVCAWYALVDSAVVGAALAYLRRRFPSHGPLRLRWDVYQLFIAQGRSLIDRHYIISGGDRLRFTKRGFDKINPLLESDSGFVLLTAHAGNWQVAMTAIGGWKKRVHLLMRLDEHAARSRELNIYTQPDQIRFIDPAGYLGGVIDVMKALDEGSIVSVMGDRDYDSSKKVPVPFMGGTAHFPSGGFLFARAARCPVAVLLSAKTGPYDYEVRIAGIIEPQADEPKGAFVERGVREYAAILDEFFQHHPMQCFLFQDLWAGPHSAAGGNPNKTRHHNHEQNQHDQGRTAAENPGATEGASRFASRA